MVNDENQKSQWCLVGNIVEQAQSGSDGDSIRKGTKHFSPKTKVYCLPAQWGDGYDQIIVIGRDRISKKFRTMIISSTSVENWRAKVVYNPEVIRIIEKATEASWRKNWESEEQLLTYIRAINKRRNNEIS